MSRSILNIILLLASITLISALSLDTVLTNVSAGSDFTLHIHNDLSYGSGSFDRHYDTYTVYLRLFPVSYEDASEPACSLTLVDVPINTTSLTVQIPPSIGPDGPGYQWAVQPVSSDPTGDYSSVPIYGPLFLLINGTGNWTDFELAGNNVNPDYWNDKLPCTSYDCVRQCSKKFYPANSRVPVHNMTKEELCAIYRTKTCANACPGVAVNTWRADDCDGIDPASTLNGTSNSTSGGSTAALPSTSASLTNTSSTGAASTPSASQTKSATGGHVEVNVVSCLFGAGIVAFLIGLDNIWKIL